MLKQATNRKAMNMDKLELFCKNQIDGLNKNIYWSGNFHTESKYGDSNLMNV